MSLVISEEKIKKMFINAVQPEETRVALVEGGVLCDIDIEVSGKEQKKASIYKGFITDIVPSLNAVFVKYSPNDKPGFLPFSEIAPEYLAKAGEDYSRVEVKEVLKKGQALIVQVDKEERGSKGAALTTFVSLAGCYLVLMPNNPGAGGISRRIAREERGELRATLNALQIPEDMGLIIRTAGLGQSDEDLKRDLEVQLALWQRIKKDAKKDLRDKDGRPMPFNLHQESNVVVRAVRDHLKPDLAEIVVDEPEIFKKIQEFLEKDRREFVDKLKLYQGSVPLFNYAKIEDQIESAFLRVIKLPSGGSIVFDQAEALTPVDVNSAKATKGGDIEETAFNTNLEAATEIARQLRLRDLGGLIVIDFIDMGSIRNQRAVEQRLREAMGPDRARVQVGRISRFGLLEMSRQRLRPALHETSRMPCTRCEGLGTIASPASLALKIIREAEEKILKIGPLAQVRMEVPIEVAAYLMNEKRDRLTAIEKNQQAKMILTPNAHMLMPNYVLEARSAQDLGLPSGQQKGDYPSSSRTEFGPLTQPQKAEGKAEPKPIKQQASGLIKRLWQALFGESTGQVPVSTEPAAVSSQSVQRHRSSMQQTRGKRADHRKPMRHAGPGQPSGQAGVRRPPVAGSGPAAHKAQAPERRRSAAAVPNKPKPMSESAQAALVPTVDTQVLLPLASSPGVPGGEASSTERSEPAVLVQLGPAKPEKSQRRRHGRQRYHKKRRPPSDSASPETKAQHPTMPVDTQRCTEE